MSEDLIDVCTEFSRQDTIPHSYIPLELTSKLRHSNRDFDFALPTRRINNRTMVVEEPSKYTYPTKLTSSFDRENYTVSTDHCYARPWNWRPEASFLRPTKMLFPPKDVQVKRKSVNSLVHFPKTEEQINVDTEPELPTPIYDVHKARSMMEECERHAFSARPERSDEDWEDKISKMNWTTTQHKMFSSMVTILNGFKIAKLAQTGVHNEPLLRRTTIDKAVKRVRRLLATMQWDTKLVQWLHQLLIDNLDPHYLALYLDILQTLKSKLPTLVDKMMYGPNSTIRLGCLNNAHLNPLLEKHWDPVASSLNQDKPKKLPSNPILLVVPTAPVMSKNLHKWIKLLSPLATVVTVPTNFGSTTHRMTMTSCIDQLFSITRGKLQDVRADYPGRPIILVGFNAGATLALQLAQVEQVLCVATFGFSLLTAEGRRGEPDDNLLELQCPVLFVIGQRSSTSSQEDLEDLRERMRVETGLIIVGSADDYLRVNKKKKLSEGITQSIVDRSIVDEVGEFISDVILSPYPPQIRQSPNHIPPELALRKGKERTRYNSNASSLDSEPPSPTPPRISRPGRPPGSKTKSRLEAKWAQQIAQGNSTATPAVNNNSQASLSPPNSPPPLYPTVPTPDTSSNDSSHPEKITPTLSKLIAEPPIKKLKTLKPIASGSKPTTPSTSPVKNQSAVQARMQAYGMNRSVIPGGSLSTLLQGGIKTIPPSQPKASASGIKVLENVTLGNGTAAKLIQNRGVDPSKITLINSVKGSNTTIGNVLVLPDGKLKTIQGSATIKGTGNTPIILTSSPQKMIPKPRNKYITAKRQLLGQKPSRSMNNPIYLPTTSIQPTLPPPTNLTTQDIMDLPIIFADDNQILEPNNVSSEASLSTSSTVSASSTVSVSLPTVTVSMPSLPKVLHTVTPGKFMLVNKQTTQGNYIITSAGLKQPSAVKNPMTFNRPPPKYTKIILSAKKHNVEDGKSKLPQCLSPEVTVKKVMSNQVQVPKTDHHPVVELIDLENEIKAMAVPKPNVPSEAKSISIMPKSSSESVTSIINKTINNPLVLRRRSEEKLPEKPKSDQGVMPGTSQLEELSEVSYFQCVGESRRCQIQPSEVPSIKTIAKNESTAVEDDGDPDYIPPKKLKLE